MEKAFDANNGKQPKTSKDSARARSQPVQGVYLLTSGKSKSRAVFAPVTTGITGATDIEVLSGLKAGDEIVTGRYKVLRALRSGTTVKVDNTIDIVTPAD
jgi:HlyD family secretion protein